jgi:hypothetical protein
MGQDKLVEVGRNQHALMAITVERLAIYVIRYNFIAPFLVGPGFGFMIYTGCIQKKLPDGSFAPREF